MSYLAWQDPGAPPLLLCGVLDTALSTWTQTAQHLKASASLAGRDRGRGPQANSTQGHDLEIANDFFSSSIG